MKSNLRNEIKSYIVRQGMTMQEVVDLLHDEHGWSDWGTRSSGSERKADNPRISRKSHRD